jgi:hypothetical protein
VDGYPLPDITLQPSVAEPPAKFEAGTMMVAEAIGLGAAFFSEVPDALALLGLALVVASGLVNIFLDGARARIASRFAEYRARKESTNPPVSEVRGPQV